MSGRSPSLGCLLALLVCGCGPAPDQPDAGADGGAQCEADVDCDDGVFCNGAEVCGAAASGGSCAAGALPCAAGETCDEAGRRCLGGECLTPDADGDGRDRIACDGDDCDDGDPDRFPGHVEVCDPLSHDEDCDGTTFGSRDADRDGFDDAACCNGAGAERACGEDCDDRRRSTHPEAVDLCDGLDNDCDGAVDELVAIDGYWDDDADGSGDVARPRTGCPGARGFALTAGDCNDDAPHQSHLVSEVCDGVDNDCDGGVDENPRPLPWYLDDDADGYASPHDDDVTVACEPPTGLHVLLPLDCDDTTALRGPRVVERCDGVDNDCNGWPDFFLAPHDYEDDDRDGSADVGCGGSDCDDTDASVLPGAPELADGIDQDCDGRTDEGAGARTFYADADGDGFGDAAVTTSAAVAPAGHVVSAGDCDDGDAAVSPDALEVCDGEDDDCDGRADEGAASTVLYADRDGDGAGVAAAAAYFCVIGALPAGFASADGDCDDDASTVAPGATELCDLVDQDCDGAIDDAPACPRMIFLTQSSVRGDFGGPAGADALCNSDPRHPGGVYKALLWAPTRHPCTTPGCSGADAPLDWVIAPDTTYRSLHGGAVMFTSNADGIITSYPMSAPLVPTGAINFWAGRAPDWTLHPSHCDGWTSRSAEAAVGWSPVTTDGWLGGGALGCGALLPLVCVQQ